MNFVGSKLGVSWGQLDTGSSGLENGQTPRGAGSTQEHSGAILRTPPLV